MYFDVFVVFEFQENQTVFISFKSQFSDEEKVTVEVNQKLFEATWINPYTCTFYFTGIPFMSSKRKTLFFEFVCVNTCIYRL